MMTQIVSNGLLVGIAALALTAPPARGQPFTQCPPVGFDTSCHVLLVVNPGGTITALTDPSQPPFDGVEDTLVGVQNNSGGPVCSIFLCTSNCPMGSNLAIFGFDGDGICAGYTPGPSGCPFGPTGYEGPGVSFTNINANFTCGDVDFTPCIADLGSDYFSLEEVVDATDFCTIATVTTTTTTSTTTTTTTTLQLKVTGGGQIQGDPIFSNLGVLLSAPALVPSLADPSAQASFGFVILPGSPPTGNLDYHDHPMNVRIMAQSYSSLNVTSGSCGPMTHAEFSGMASVMRSTGTTTEPFTVKADDCGEPGTSDKFGIMTTSYSNGPSTLIAGNIQIHKK